MSIKKKKCYAIFVSTDNQYWLSGCKFPIRCYMWKVNYFRLQSS